MKAGDRVRILTGGQKGKEGVVEAVAKIQRNCSVRIAGVNNGQPMVFGRDILRVIPSTPPSVLKVC